MRAPFVWMLSWGVLALLAGCSHTVNRTAAAPDEWQTAAPAHPPAGIQPSPWGSNAPLAGMRPAVQPAPAPVTPPPNVQSADRTIPTMPAPAGASIPSGVLLAVRIEAGVPTRRNRAGDGFDATLVEAMIVDGKTILPAGTPFRGHVTRAKPAGRVKGRTVPLLTLDGFRLGDRRYRIRTDQVGGGAGGESLLRFRLESPVEVHAAG